MLNLILSIILVMSLQTKKISELTDFNTFCIEYLPHLFYDGQADFHYEIDAALYDRSIKHLVIEAMRASGKTTHSIAYCLYNICEGDDLETHIISRSGEKDVSTAIDIMDKIKNELEHNDLLIHDYGIKKGKKWTGTRIDVHRRDGKTVKFTSRGKKASIRGARGTIIIDDPQNKADCRSETVLKADEDWFFSDSLPVLLKNNRIIFIGTSMSPLSLIAKVKKLEDFKVLSFPLEQPIGSGNSRWKQHYSNEWIAMQKRIMGLDRFNEEYNCMPLVSGNPVFRKEWFQHYDPDSEQFRKIKTMGLYKVTGVDGAESKSNQADYSAVITIGATYGKFPDIYILEVKRNHWTTPELAAQIMLTYNEHRQHKTIVESRVKPKGTQQVGDALCEEIVKAEKMHRRYVNLYAFKPTTDKVQRAHYVQPTFQDCRVYFNPNDKTHEQLMEELEMFTGENTFPDDQVDALSCAITEIVDWAENFDDTSAEPTIVREDDNLNIIGRMA